MKSLVYKLKLAQLAFMIASILFVMIFSSCKPAMERIVNTCQVSEGIEVNAMAFQSEKGDCSSL